MGPKRKRKPSTDEEEYIQQMKFASSPSSETPTDDEDDHIRRLSSETATVGELYRTPSHDPNTPDDNIPTVIGKEDTNDHVVARYGEAYGKRIPLSDDTAKRLKFGGSRKRTKRKQRKKTAKRRRYKAKL